MNQTIPAMPAREELLRWVDAAGEAGRGFLQLWIRGFAEGRYELRHLADRRCPLDDLALHTDPQSALDLARTTEGGRHRPLRTMPDLRRGWVLPGLDGPGLWNALNRFYPAAGVHWYQQRRGELRVTSFAESAERQSGIYASVGTLRGEPLRAAIRACCTGTMCLRRPAWAPAAAVLDGVAPSGRIADDGMEHAAVPCSEPCSLLLTFAREVIRFEEEQGAFKQSAPSTSALTDALHIAADRSARSGRLPFETADFTQFTNPRWLLYFAERLERASAEHASSLDPGQVDSAVVA